MTGDEVRQKFLSFFEEKGHKVVPGSSLIPHGDPTLLLTSAGMVQFKPYFLGEATPPCPRLASCQKCFRTTDIEVVGDTTHLTFFEMLGNFSVGDYFKRDAIAWAWQFVTERLGLPPERLWITVYLDDDEAFDIWRKLGIPEGRILRFGEKDNFWGPAGDSGPCGPCSEIHYDFGVEVGCGKSSCQPNCDCGRFSEIWNLVFIQYNQDREGERTPLDRCHIDTGMGLERTAAVMQNKPSVYETDLFAPLVELVSRLSGKKYGEDSDADNAMRVVAEHGRGITFLIADGVMPSNDGRGYVLRRLLRRAALFGRRLGLDKPFLAEIAKTTIDKMGYIYPELKDRRSSIHKVIDLEEDRFGDTLSVGLGLLDDTVYKVYMSVKNAEKEMKKAFGIANRSKPGTIEGKKAIEIVREAKEKTSEFLKALEVLRKTPEALNKSCMDDVRFKLKIAQQYCRNAKEATQVAEKAERNQEIINGLKELTRIIIKTVGEKQFVISGKQAFKLYDTYGFPIELTREIAAEQNCLVDMAGFEREMEKQRERAKNSHRFKTKDLADKVGVSVEDIEFVGYDSLKCRAKVVAIIYDAPIDNIKEGQKADVVLDKTPFYAEMGGQVGDTGEIASTAGRFVVTDTIQSTQGVIMHRGYVAEGGLSTGDGVEAVVDKERRLDIARNHTATHLLQLALRRVLGEHVHQRGSLVAPDRLRFDFSHLTAMTQPELDEVQRIVNQEIRSNLPVSPCYIPYKQAMEEGAIALFDEKYGDVVRVLKIGQPAVSAELCGGTHVSATGEIGFFYILSESSIGGGLRRIEAVTGKGAEQAIKQRVDYLKGEIAATEVLLEEERRHIRELERERARKEANSYKDKVEIIRGVPVNIAITESYEPELMREIADIVRGQMKSGIVALGAVREEKPVFIVAMTPDMVDKGYHAGEMVKKVAAIAGGGGGGKASLAQGSGKDKGKMKEALGLVRSLI